MNTKTFIGGLIGGIVFFLLGFLLYGVLFGKMMEAHSNMSCMRSMEDMNMVLMVVANLIWGITFAYIFNKANIADEIRCHPRCYHCRPDWPVH